MKAQNVLKPVLIGFILGLALMGASRLASQDTGRPQLTSTQAHLQAHGAAIGHVSAPTDCGRYGPLVLV